MKNILFLKKISILTTLVIILFFDINHANSALYKCKDRNGNLVFTDKLSSSCQDSELERVDGISLETKQVSRPIYSKHKNDRFNIQLINGLKFYPFPADQSDFYTNDMYVGDRFIWLSSPRGIMSFNLETKRFYFIAPSPLEGHNISAIAVDEIKGEVYAAISEQLTHSTQASKFLYVFNLGNNEWLKVADIKPQELAFHNGILWFGGASALGWLDTENPNQLHEQKNTPGWVWALAAEGDHAWFAHRGNSKANPPTPGGVSLINSKTQESKLISEDDTYSLTLSPTYIWLCPTNGKLAQINKTTNEFHYFKKSIDDVFLSCSRHTAATDTDVWIASAEYLYNFHIPTNRIANFEVSTINHSNARTIITDIQHKNNLMWISIADQGVASFYSNGAQ